MKLTGKALKDFIDWQIDCDWFEPSCFHRDATNLEIFEQLNDSMQYGVLVDWFDSVGLRINIIEFGMLQFQVQFYQFDGDKSMLIIPLETRHEARTQAIIKANEIYNEK